MLHVVLFQPEIPHNTGAIGRLCLATGARLHLIHPLGFSLEDKYLKRTGLDYWQHVDVRQYDDWEAFRAAMPSPSAIFFVECGGETDYWATEFTEEEVFLVFGPETRSLPPSLLENDCWLRIPMREGGTRSLNLATAAAIVMYEAMRQRTLAGIAS